MKKAIAVLWLTCGMAWGQDSSSTQQSARHDVWTINVPVQQAAPAHLDVSTEFCSETVTMGHTTKYFRDIFPEECGQSVIWNESVSGRVRLKDGRATAEVKNPYLCTGTDIDKPRHTITAGNDGEIEVQLWDDGDPTSSDLVFWSCSVWSIGYEREPELVDVPAIRGKRHVIKPGPGRPDYSAEEKRRYLSGFAEECVYMGGKMSNHDCAMGYDYSCRDKSRVLLTDESGGKHCIDFSLIEPRIHQSSAY